MGAVRGHICNGYFTLYVMVIDARMESFDVSTFPT